MSYIAKTAFEVTVSNIARNNTQNVAGKFQASNADADCSSGLLCVQSKLMPATGYTGINNLNTWIYNAASNGASTLYACNPYGLPYVSDGKNVWQGVSRQLLGQGVPAGVVTDFTEIIEGEMYTFGEGNFSAVPTVGKFATVGANGLLAAAASAPEAGSGFYFEVLASKVFTEGARAAFTGYVCRALKI